MQSEARIRHLCAGNRLYRGVVRLLLPAVLISALLAFPMPGAAADDVLPEAKSLVYRGKEHRAQALTLLERRLAEAPDDTEARVFYGIVLSWDGRYDEARDQLSRVLAARPAHGDALPALINVELWSDHPNRADALAREALAREPNSIPLLLADARALRNMNRRAEALQVLDRVLALDHSNQEARAMRRSLSQAGQSWQANINHSYDWFSDGRDPLHQTSVSLRGQTRLGSITGSFNRADQYSLVSHQMELELYPHFRPGTYGYLEVGYSPDGDLYPTYRVGADLFQSLGRGYEVSGGYRHLAFGSGVNIYTFALAKYYRNWLFTGRGFLTPGSAGPSGTALLSARYFLGAEGQHDFVELRYSRGASPALASTLRDIQVLTSSRFSVEFDKVLRGGFTAAWSGGIAQEQRVGLSDLRRYSLQGSLYYRF